jgi:hypothetical protein
VSAALTRADGDASLDIPMEPATAPHGSLLQVLLRRQARADAGLRALAAKVARMQAVEVGDRVVFHVYGDTRVTMHGFVVELARRPADDVLGAWVRVIGFSAWVCFTPLADLSAVCGVCGECLRLNDWPGCAGPLQGGDEAGGLLQLALRRARQ